jgi:SNF family Na+-dependent transporter
MGAGDGIGDKLKKGICSKGTPPEEEKKQEPEEVNPNQPDGQGRIQWSSPVEFLLTCVGYSVGLGNVWRFPYLCYKSGGGAFLIPYIIMMILIGMPLLFMEYSFGQYFGVGSLSIFKKVCPLLQGIGIGYTVLNALVCIYYNVIIAISLYYLFASCAATLPWATCGNWWNTEHCSDQPFVPGNDTFGNGTFGSMFDYNTNSTILMRNLTNYTRTSPSDEYFKFNVLDMHPEHSISNLGEIRWHLSLCLLLAWILVVIFVSRGIQSTGKVAYFTATFPYLMLTVLVVRGVTLPGASTGILYFLTPDWSRLAEPEIWFGAASQLFYSTNLAWGGMITMASYNSFNHNCYRDAVVINIVSFCTSIYAGLAVFSIIGYMANEYNIDVRDVIDSGPGLAFVVYPRALSLMPVAPLFSILFFFMLFLLGIGSQMVLIETVVTGFVDEFPFLGKNACIRLMTTISVCSFFFFAGLAATTQGGMYVLQLMDWYAASFCVLVIAIVECVAINWIYGNAKFAANVKEMMGQLPGRWWTLCWKYISPLIILAVLVFSLVKYEPAKYGDMLYPAWADGLGWCMTMASVLPIPAVAIWKYYKAEGQGFWEKWRSATKPRIQIEVKKVGEDLEEGLEAKLKHDIELNGDVDDAHAADTLLSKEKEAEANNTSHV